MTVESTVPFRKDYTADGETNEFAYPFQIFEAGDITVYLNGVVKTLNTDYTVDNVGVASGGFITFTMTDSNGDDIDIADGDEISFVMDMDLDRTTNYQPSGAFLASEVNDDFDRLWLATNQQAQEIDRSLRLKADDITTSNMEIPAKADRQGKLLGFNASTGDPEVSDNNYLLWNAAYNDKINYASFSGSTLTLNQQDGSTITASHTPYLPIAGGTLTGDLTVGNLSIESVGGNATQISETGAGNFIIKGSNLSLTDANNEIYINCTSNGDVKLYHDNSEKLATTSDGINITGNLNFGDNEIAKFGDSNDLQIYHTGSSSVIQDQGDGNLGILGTDIQLANSDGTQNYIVCQNGLGVNIYHNNNIKFATTTTGVNITGTINATGYNDSNWNTAYNNMITAVDFSNSTLTLTQQDGGTLTTTINGGLGQWTTSGNNIYYNTGNVGIGTSSPTSQLTVTGTGGANSGFAVNNSNESVKGYFANDNADSDFLLTYVGSSSAEVKLKHNGNVVLCESAGNVGINNASPSTALDVDGTITAVGLNTSGQIISQRTDNNAGLVLKSSDTDANSGPVANFIRNNAEAGATGDALGHIRFMGQDSASDSQRYASITAHIEDPTDASYIGGLDIAVAYNAQMKNRISIKHVNDQSAVVINEAGDDVDFRVESDTNQHALFLRGSDGNVGIGTNNPDKLLHIRGENIPASLRLERSTTELAAGAPIGVIEFESNDSSTGSSGVVGKIEVRAEDTSPDARMSFYTHDNNSGTGTLTEQMRITSNGYVGIKKAGNPTTELDVNGTVTATDFAGDGSNLTGVLSNVVEDTTPQLGGDLDLNSNNITGTGNVTCTKLLAGSGNNSAPGISFYSNTNTGLTNPAQDAIGFVEGGTERMRITANGNIAIGTTVPYEKLHVNGRVRASSIRCTSNGSYIHSAGFMGGPGLEVRHTSSSSSTSYQNMIEFERSDGTAVGSIKSHGSATQYNTSSDERMKENIQDAGDAGTKIDAIQIRQFDWKDSNHHEDFGVIAQELNEVAPEAVSQGYTEEDMWGVDYSKLVPTLIKEIQSLRRRVEELESAE